MQQLLEIRYNSPTSPFLLPKETDPKRKATLRHEYNKDYSLGIDDMKTRAAIIAYTGLSESERDKIKNEDSFLIDKNNKYNYN